MLGPTGRQAKSGQVNRERAGVQSASVVIVRNEPHIATAASSSTVFESVDVALVGIRNTKRRGIPVDLADGEIPADLQVQNPLEALVGLVRGLNRGVTTPAYLGAILRLLGDTGHPHEFLVDWIG